MFYGRVDVKISVSRYVGVMYLVDMEKDFMLMMRMMKIRSLGPT